MSLRVLQARNRVLSDAEGSRNRATGVPIIEVWDISGEPTDVMVCTTSIRCCLRSRGQTIADHRIAISCGICQNKTRSDDFHLGR